MRRAERHSAVKYDRGRTPCGATHSPLIEPDKRISRHPALLKTVVSGMRRQLHGCQPLQIHQSKSLDLLIVADPFRRLVGPVASPSRVPRQTVSNGRVYLTEALAWIPRI